MVTLVGEARHHEDIRKSRFLAQAIRADAADAALAFMSRVGANDATHHCWAYRIGALYRFSDDGEPGGSAGRPILAAIDGQGMDHVVVVVTRWFGGVKLGVGGLARAYGGCAAECLRRADTQELIERIRVRVACDFSAAATLHGRLYLFEASKLAERTNRLGMELDLDLPTAHVAALARFIGDLTRGRGTLDVAP